MPYFLCKGDVAQNVVMVLSTSNIMQLCQFLQKSFLTPSIKPITA